MRTAPFARVPWSPPSPSRRSSRRPRWRKRPPAAAPAPAPDSTRSPRTSASSASTSSGASRRPPASPPCRAASTTRIRAASISARGRSNISWLEDFGAYTVPASSGTSTAATRANFPGSEDWTYDVGTLYYYYPGKRNPGFANANTWEIYGAINWKWLGAKASLQPPGLLRRATHRDRRPTAPGTSTSPPTIRSARPAFTLLAHFGILDVRNDGSGNTKVGYNDWKLGVSYAVADGVLKGVEVGAYYSGNNAKKAFYTDLTGYNTAKDTGVVYVKKTF